MQKTFSRSQVLFGSEIVTTTLNAPRTREEVRSQSGLVNIQAIDGGIGYQIIGNNNQIA